jgi:two-component system, OmpR family, KDP operon response regulator KdpE
MSKKNNVVLVIEDEPRIRYFLKAGFEVHGGFSVLEAGTGAQGTRTAAFASPDIVILDLRLPDIPGAEVLERIRSWSSIPIIILSVVSDEDEKVRLLGLGADDFVIKPFGIAELIARCEAVLRRYYKSAKESSVVTAGSLSIDLVHRTVFVNDREIKITNKQFRLLRTLAENVDLIVTHEQLLQRIWPDSQQRNLQYLRVLVRDVRCLIESDPNHPLLITNVSGIGYRLNLQAAV